MSKIEEIIKTGKAPGVRTGAVDPQSVFALAPKAFKEIERGEGRSRGQGPMSARDISRYMGLSTDKLKSVWRETNPKAFACLLVLLFALQAQAYVGGLSTGETFTDGQTVHAADLNNAINNATINPVTIYGLPLDNQPLIGDYVSVYSAANGQQLYRVPLGTIMANPQSYTTLGQLYPSYTTNDLFQFYSANTTNLQSVVFSNLVADIATNINLPLLANINFSPTNNNTGATNKPVLPNYPANAAWLFSGLNTNNQPFFLTWASNGIPYQQPLSNLESAVQSDLGTNAYVYRQIFQPWNVYGTNTTMTNFWYGPTNFAITNINQPASNGFLTNNEPTLVDADTVPIGSTLQGTNTTATLLALYGYMTNKNALPPYTQARIQFNGGPGSFILTNTANTSYSLIGTTITNLASNAIYAVSFITNGVQYWTGMNSNQVYYVVPQTTNASWYSVYSNYSTAAFALANGQQGEIPIVATGAGAIRATMLYLTNFTSYNADVTQVVTPGTPDTIRTGVYDVWFRTNSATPFYYVTGTAEQTASIGNPIWMNISSDNLLTTNFVRIATFSSASANTPANSSLVHVLISPQ